MASIGDWVELRVVREKPHGLYLDSEGKDGEVLLPRREMPSSWQLGESLQVFLYCDSDDRPVATTIKPKALPGEYACLKVVASTNVGAFLDWGLSKDLLLPFGEQKGRIEAGRKCVVRVEVDDESGRIIATQRLGRYLDKTPARYHVGEKVELMMYGKTELGYKAIINECHRGMLYANEVFRDLKLGELTTGYIKELRADGKIDLSLYPIGRGKVSELETKILDELKNRGGQWHLTDSSSPEEIHAELGVSKKVFKQALGALFRKRIIRIEESGIHLVKSED